MNAAALKPLINGALGRAGLQLVRTPMAGVLPHYPPLTPPLLDEICRRYDASARDEQETLSRYLMTKTTLEPGFARLMVDEFPRDWFHAHPLFRHITAARRFADGGLDAAKQIFRDLAEQTPTPAPFDVLCLARTLIADGSHGEAREILARGVSNNPRDLYLVMEASGAAFRDGDIEQANQLLGRVKDQVADEQKNIAALQAEIDAAIDGNLFAKKAAQDIYTDDFVTATWWEYWFGYKSFNAYQEGGSSLDQRIRQEFARALKRLEVTHVVDFGAFCGYTIALMAEAFPHISFIGIDRPGIAKELNDQAFHQPNLRFVAGDALTELDRIGLGERTALFHSRTGCFCYPAYLAALYAKARAIGVQHILLQEMATFSRTTMAYYRLGEYPRISLAGRGKTFMHDYKRLLNDAGYGIISSSSVQPTVLLDNQNGFGCDHRLVHAAC